MELSIPEYQNNALDDWSWWVRDKKGNTQRCRSIEHRYLAKSPDEEKRHPKRVVDVIECQRIEKAITSESFPTQYRRLIVGWYVHRAPRIKICRRANVPMVDLNFMIVKACDELFLSMAKKSVDTYT